MTSFHCMITFFKVSSENLDEWYSVLNKNLPSLCKAHYKYMSNFDASNIDEYFNIIKNAILSETLEEVMEKAKIKKEEKEKKELEEEKALNDEKIKESFHTINEKTCIKIVDYFNEEEIKEATNLMTLFREELDEDVEDIEDYAKYEIVCKNYMYGLFLSNLLIGYFIITHKKFDFLSENKTFYIQEIFISKEYRGQKLSDQLLKYILTNLRVDDVILTSIVQPSNVGVIKTFSNNGFKIHDNPSGSSKFSLLMYY